MNKVNKMQIDYLSFLDNNIISIIIIIILVLYVSNIFKSINNLVKKSYNNYFVRLIILILIVLITPKSPIIGTLLGISYVISLNKNSYENFATNNYVIDNEIINYNNFVLKINDKENYIIFNNKNNNNRILQITVTTDKSKATKFKFNDPYTNSITNPYYKDAWRYNISQISNSNININNIIKKDGIDKIIFIYQRHLSFSNVYYDSWEFDNKIITLEDYYDDNKTKDNSNNDKREAIKNAKLVAIT
jgi:hypothetical protein